MELLILLLVAIAMIILGARGTYAAVWNQFFPNQPIVTTPTTQQGTPAGSSSSGGSSYNPSGGQPGQTPTTPVQVGQQAANNTRQWISGLAGNSGGSNTTRAPIVVPPGKQAIVSTGVPSWWPSWLPYPPGWPRPGAGFTGQYRNTP